MTDLFQITDLHVTSTTEARIPDLLLAERLGLADPHKIRTLIRSNWSELTAFGEVSARQAETSARGGRPGTEYLLNEGQALVVCALSRTLAAAAVRRALIAVFMAWRHGGTAQPKPAMAEPQPCRGRVTEAVAQEIRSLYATGQWRQIDLAARFGLTQSEISTIVRAGRADSGPDVVGLIEDALVQSQGYRDTFLRVAWDFDNVTDRPKQEARVLHRDVIREALEDAGLVRPAPRHRARLARA